MQEIASLVVRATNAELSESSRLTAFEEIVCRYQDMAVGYAFSLLGDFQLAEDTAQEALIDAWRNLESLVEPRAFSAWFRRIVARRCDRLTRRKRIPTTPLEAAMNVMDRHPAPDEQLEHNELRAVILNAIRALLDHERDATTLYYISGYTQAEVADFLDAPVGTIKQRLHSARKRLRKGLMHMVRDSLREYAPSRDTAFADRISRLIQPSGMKTSSYQYGIETVDGNDAWRLMVASAEGDLNDVRRLVKKDPNLVNAEFWYQFPIHFAVREGHAEVAKFLLNSGAEPGRSRYMYNSWQNLVKEAKRRGFTDVLAVLEDTLRERFGYHPDFEQVAQAMRDRDVEKVRAFIAARPELAKASDVRGNNALHWIGLTYQPELIDLFLKHGAPLDAQRADGQTPAMLTISGDYWYRRHRDLPESVVRDHWAIVDRLLAAGAEYNLSIAILKQDKERVRELLEARPELARQLDPSRCSYLAYAAQTRQTDIAAMLLQLGADPSSPEALAPVGRALHEASAKNHLEMVELLLKHGADPNSEVDSSASALMRSIGSDPEGPDAKRVQQLLREHGAKTPFYGMDDDELRAFLEDGDGVEADWDIMDRLYDIDDPEMLRRVFDKNPSAIRMVEVMGAYPKSAECIDLMISRGVDLNITDWLGKTWLHYIASQNNLEVARLFIERGANVNAVESENRGTPLAEAARNGHLEMVKLLLEHGANPNLPDDLWARPLAWATDNGHAEVVALLKQHGAIG